MVEKKLREMPYAQATVIKYISGKIVLRSYETDVATITDGWLYICGLYSMTTRKHLKAFCKEYTPISDFQTIKAIAEQRLRYNLNTGEVESI